jgi:hypothetical protein
VPLQPANAADEADSMTAKPAPAKVQPARCTRDDATEIEVILSPQQKPESRKDRHCKNLEQWRGLPKAFAARQYLPAM